LARLRDDYDGFAGQNAEILAVGPDAPSAFRKYWRENRIPFIGLPDPVHRVARLYRQEVNLFKLGRMPLNAVLDRSGHLRYVHYGDDMTDIPDNEMFLQVIAQVNAASE
jgi:peroxiredoxin Q/BCP